MFALAAMALPLAASAQTIDFETEATSGKQYGVYDTWEASPFRTAKLTGNFAVVDNPTTQEINPINGSPYNASSKVLGVQRSRFGSNTFGVRIDLNTPFELTKKAQYLHVWVHRPKPGRVMVVGLGKRRERAEQSPETEQFWGMTTASIEGGTWQEAVIPIKGNGGIDIYSLVIVPDCESPHDLANDFIAYVDNIEINDIARPSLVTDFFPINFDKTQTYTRQDRHLDAIRLSAPTDGAQAFRITKTKPIYTEAGSNTFRAKAGENVTPSFTYTGSWMHGYVYLDLDRNGVFSAETPQKELLAYSFLGDTDESGKNSAGITITGSARNTLNPPSFTIPAHLAPGFYMLRYKVDWNNADPGGNTGTENGMLKNGGAFVDIRLNVHADHASLTTQSRNGEVLAADGTKLIKLQVPFGQDFAIKMNPENGFEYKGIVVKHGYNLAGDSIVKGTRQWERTIIPRRLFNENDMTYTIPGKYLDGDVEIEGLFIENGTYVPEPDDTPRRYPTTTIEQDHFAKDTPWHSIQIGQQGYVLIANGTEPMNLSATSVNENDPRQLWCFVGNDNDGYKIYNKAAGASKVLAAPTSMSARAGETSHPTLQNSHQLPEGYTALWNFSDSNDLGTGKQYAYLYEFGLENNKVNNRNSKLAFWNEGQDSGSTLTVKFVASGNSTGIHRAAETPQEQAPSYDLSGRIVTSSQSPTIQIRNGKKMLQ